VPIQTHKEEAEEKPLRLAPIASVGSGIDYRVIPRKPEPSGADTFLNLPECSCPQKRGITDRLQKLTWPYVVLQRGVHPEERDMPEEIWTVHSRITTKSSIA
jgi:hypothetical protein